MRRAQLPRACLGCFEWKLQACVAPAQLSHLLHYANRQLEKLGSCLSNNAYSKACFGYSLENALMEDCLCYYCLCCCMSPVFGPYVCFVVRGALT